MDQARLEQHLATLSGFEDPTAALEQYTTPAPLAARLIHLASLHDDLTRPVLDLGTGTGILAIGAAIAGPPTVIGIDRDRTSLETARHNESTVPVETPIAWILADATTPPVAAGTNVTLLANPPFGAHKETRHADRRFLTAVAPIATVSYTIHNVDSLSFLESFVADHDGTLTHAYEAELDLPHQFPWHTDESQTQAVEVVRIEW